MAFGTVISIRCLPGWQELTGPELIENIRDVGMVRLLGLDMPLDIFRQPNEIEVGEFDTLWTRAEEREDGTRLPLEVDLLRTKENTGRTKDLNDHMFLLEKARRKVGESLKDAKDVSEAERILEDFLDPFVLAIGLENTNVEVRQHLLKHAKTLADEGDPFTRDLLEGRDFLK